MRNRSFKPVAALLAILLLTGVPVHADPIVVKDVIQRIHNYRNPPDLQLRNLPQNPTQSFEVNGLYQNPGGRSVKGSRDFLIPSTDSLLNGLAVGPDTQQIDVIAQGDIEGTVCDCGDIEIAGGFPKWPLFLLGGIPFFFINGSDELPLPPLTPTPNPTPPSTPPIPEPASLLLFGTGIAAFGIRYRRRRARLQSNAETAAGKDRT